jgi:hypothetical protein
MAELNGETTNNVIIFINNIQFTLKTKKPKVSKYSNEKDFYHNVLGGAIDKLIEYLRMWDIEYSILPDNIFIDLTQSTPQSTPQTIEDIVYKELLQVIIEQKNVSVYIYAFQGAQLTLTIIHDVIFEDFFAIKQKFLYMFGHAFEVAVKSVNFRGHIEFKTKSSFIESKHEALEEILDEQYPKAIDSLSKMLIVNMQGTIMQDEALAIGETSHNTAQTSMNDEAMVFDTQRRWLDAIIADAASDTTATNEDDSRILTSRLIQRPISDETYEDPRRGNPMARSTKKKPTLFKRIKNLVLPSRTKIYPLERIEAIRLGGMKRTQKKRYKKSQKKRYKRRPKRRATKRT